MHSTLKPASLILIASLLSGCNTLQLIDETGDSYDKGDYVSGTLGFAFLAPFMLLADVFTFGGSMDAEQSSQTWATLAEQQGQLQQQQQLQAQQRQLAQQQAQYAAQQAALAAQQEAEARNRSIMEFQQRQADYHAQQAALQTQQDNNRPQGGISHNPPAAPAAPAAPQPVRQPDRVSGQVISANYRDGGTAYHVQVQNTGNVKISCNVIVDYKYARNMTLENERTTVNTGMIPVGSSGTAKLSSGSNISVSSYRTSCSKWPFQ